MALSTAAAPVRGQAPSGQTIVLQQPGFPTIASEPIPRTALASAIPGATFADLAQLRVASTLGNAKLLVLPYGSAVPTAAWPAILAFLGHGGSLLILGGQPFHVPVTGDTEGSFQALAPQDSYSRELGFLHTYAAPLPAEPLRFAWRDGYTFLPRLALQPTAVFVEEGHLNGLAYLDSADHTHRAAPVIVADHLGSETDNGARIVALPFTAPAGFWTSPDGQTLLRSTAQYALAGATSFSVELQYNALRPGETPAVTLHLHQAHSTAPSGTAHIDLLEGTHVLATESVPLGGAEPSAAVPFTRPTHPGVYTLRATWSASTDQPPQEFAENGFVVEDLANLESGPAFGAQGNFLTSGDKPFFPVGTNYFSTDANGWDFSGPRNGATWERDFADMQHHGVNFVRTGVWMPSFSKFVEGATGEANERFLRNLEAFLASAHRHGIIVNFTCFAFTPHGQDRGRRSSDTTAEPTPPNPYLDETTVRQEQAYVTSVVRRFRRLPFLSWDLINEPSFTNPRNIFHGNLPNGDPAEIAAWRKWLRERYKTLPALADAWRVTPEELGSFDTLPLPHATDIAYNRYGTQTEVRALDYNLFAQDMFSGWVRGMVSAIHQTGSTQLINVGQDEGGVTNRVLNQFYATAGVSFTTNHTYWADDALLWDSVAAKRPGLPNITGETGYQPAWNPDGTWRYDELTGTALEERKWALGFAAGSSGAVQWDWDREFDFGMQRSDGSAKIWQGMMRDLGAFASAAAPFATGLLQPEVALVLPQSFQLSTRNPDALAAQQAAVRALFQGNRVEAYAVGEYQTDVLGTPKLIIVPSAYGLNARAWADITARVRAGAVLLLSGPFAADEHLHPTDRAEAIGLPAGLTELLLRDNTLTLPSGTWPLLYDGLKTTFLDRATLPGDKSWTEIPLGQGRILFSVFPLELNTNETTIDAAYDLALKAAGVQHTYTTDVREPGILICPTRFPRATLYVLTSEAPTQIVQFTDARSGKSFSGTLEAGHAALLLVGEHGDLLANYRWNPAP